MPSDIILDSLCAEGIARKTIRPMQSFAPEHPYKSLGARHDTTFFNPVTQYTIEFLIAKNDATTFLLKPGIPQKQPEEFPPTLIDHLKSALQYINELLEGGGIPFVSSHGSGDPGLRRARFPDPPVNIDWLIALLGPLSLGRSSGLEIANALANLFDGLNNLGGKKKEEAKSKEYVRIHEEFIKATKVEIDTVIWTNTRKYNFTKREDRDDKALTSIYYPGDTTCTEYRYRIGQNPNLYFGEEWYPAKDTTFYYFHDPNDNREGGRYLIKGNSIIRLKMKVTPDHHVYINPITGVAIDSVEYAK